MKKDTKGLKYLSDAKEHVPVGKYSLAFDPMVGYWRIPYVDSNTRKCDWRETSFFDHTIVCHNKLFSNK